MKRIVHPKCTACQSGPQTFESERFPALRVCYPCVKGLTDWLLVNRLADSNILFEGLVKGSVESKEMELYSGEVVWMVMGPSQHMPGAHTWWTVIPLTQLDESFESKNKYLDPLDNL